MADWDHVNVARCPVCGEHFDGFTSTIWAREDFIVHTQNCSEKNMLAVEAKPEAPRDVQEATRKLRLPRNKPRRVQAQQKSAEARVRKIKLRFKMPDGSWNPLPKELPIPAQPRSTVPDRLPATAAEYGLAIDALPVQQKAAFRSLLKDCAVYNEESSDNDSTLPDVYEYDPEEAAAPIQGGGDDNSVVTSAPLTERQMFMTMVPHTVFQKRSEAAFKRSYEDAFLETENVLAAMQKLQAEYLANDCEIAYRDRRAPKRLKPTDLHIITQDKTEADLYGYTWDPDPEKRGDQDILKQMDDSVWVGGRQLRGKARNKSGPVAEMVAMVEARTAKKAAAAAGPAKGPAKRGLGRPRGSKSNATSKATTAEPASRAPTRAVSEATPKPTPKPTPKAKRGRDSRSKSTTVPPSVRDGTEEPREESVATQETEEAPAAGPLRKRGRPAKEPKATPAPKKPRLPRPEKPRAAGTRKSGRLLAKASSLEPEAGPSRAQSVPAPPPPSSPISAPAPEPAPASPPAKRGRKGVVKLKLGCKAAEQANAILSPETQPAADVASSVQAESAPVVSSPVAGPSSVPAEPTPPASFYGAAKIASPQAEPASPSVVPAPQDIVVPSASSRVVPQQAQPIHFVPAVLPAPTLAPLAPAPLAAPVIASPRQFFGNANRRARRGEFINSGRISHSDLSIYDSDDANLYTGVNTDHNLYKTYASGKVVGNAPQQVQMAAEASRASEERAPSLASSPPPPPPPPTNMQLDFVMDTTVLQTLMTTPDVESSVPPAPPAPRKLKTTTADPTTVSLSTVQQAPSSAPKPKRGGTRLAGASKNLGDSMFMPTLTPATFNKKKGGKQARGAVHGQEPTDLGTGTASPMTSVMRPVNSAGAAKEGELTFQQFNGRKEKEAPRRVTKTKGTWGVKATAGPNALLAPCRPNQNLGVDRSVTPTIAKWVAEQEERKLRALEQKEREKAGTEEREKMAEEEEGEEGGEKKDKGGPQRQRRCAAPGPRGRAPDR